MSKYITDKRLLFKRGQQRKFIYDLKNAFNLTWSEIAKSVGLSKYTISIAWGKEQSTIPYSYMKKLIRKYPFQNFNYILSNYVKEILPQNWGQIKGGNNSAKNLMWYGGKPINLPNKNSTRFAEFVGIMLGDGHLSSTGIEITLEYPAENAYKNYIANLLAELFGRKPITRFKKHNTGAVYLIINSKKLVRFLNDAGLMTGNKISNGVSIPKFISTDKSLLRACIRGLIDTDGGIFQKQKGYSRCLIEFENNCKPLLSSVSVGLSDLGFAVSKGGGSRAIRIQTQNEIIKYVNEIGFSNIKNIIRYSHFEKSGQVPNKNKLREIISSEPSLAW